MTCPDIYAWEVFCKITEAKPGSKRAGWESWVSAARLYADPTFLDFPEDRREPVPEFSTAVPTKTEAGQLLTSIGVVQPPKHPEKPFPFSDKSKLTRKEDVYLNKQTVDYIVKNNLYFQEGQQAMANTPNGICFPAGSIEVKAMWVYLVQESDQAQFYCQKDSSGKVWGLQSLHLTTKDIPNWFWATFEHESNYGKEHPVPFPQTDNWGYKCGAVTANLLALFDKHHLPREVWTHYRLGGSQVDYTDSAGRPIVRGNNMIEGGLKGAPATQSSCMSCHARSTIGQFLDFNLGEDRIGSPKPAWFYGLNNQMVESKANVQRDFVWSLSRAKHKDVAGAESIFWSIGNKTQISFANDIYPLFRKKDIEAMLALNITPWDYQCVVANKQKVIDMYNHNAQPYLPAGYNESSPSFWWSPYLRNELQIWAANPAP